MPNTLAASSPRISLPAHDPLTLRVIPMPADANPNGDIFGGWIMSQVDVAGSVPPMPVDIAALAAGKKIVIFGLPGAFTPTCSAQHVPGYVKHFDALKAKGVDEIICMAVNDGFVMGAWGQTQHAEGKVRMMGDGSAAFTKALGLELDLTAKGMGVRCQRFSLLVENGVVKHVNVEGVGPANCSFAENMLAQLG